MTGPRLSSTELLAHKIEAATAQAVSRLSPGELSVILRQLAACDDAGGPRIVGAVAEKLLGLGLVFESSGRLKPIAIELLGD